MPLLDTIQNAAMRVLPEKKSTLPMHTSNSGIGSSGHVPFEDDVSLHPVITSARALPLVIPHSSSFLSAYGRSCPFDHAHYDSPFYVYLACPHVARSKPLCRPYMASFFRRGLRKVHVSSTPSTASMGSSVQTAGYLTFLLFVPLLSTLWIWVHITVSLLIPSDADPSFTR